MKQLSIFLLSSMLSMVALGGNYSPIKTYDHQTINSVNLKLPSFEKRNAGEMNPGIVAMISGGSFMTAGILTGSLDYGWSSERKQPIKNQPGRLGAIISGGLIFVGGLTYTIVF